MTGFRMLAFNVVEGEVLSKTFESFFSLPKILFKNIFKLTHTLKTTQKGCLENFEINMKIN